MKFVQIHNFYDPYLESFYKARPQLFEAPYAQQYRALMDDAFSATHMFADHLGPYGFEPHLFIANDRLSQVRWCLEQGISLKPSPTIMQDIVRLQIEHIKPDVLYLSHSIDFDSRFVRSLTWKPKFVFGWRAASIPEHIDYTAYNLLLSSDPGCRETALKQGAQAVRHFLPGFPEWVAERVAHEPKTSDIVFCGHVTAEHTRRNQLLAHIVRSAASTRAFNPRFYVSEVCDALQIPEATQYKAEAVWGLAMHRAIKSGKIGFNAHIDLADRCSGNMRQFEIMGTGTMMLTEHHDSLHEYFDIGKEIETFRDQNELIEKIIYFSRHDQEREAIALRGQQKCFQEHGMRKRVAEFVDIVKEGVQGTSRSVASSYGAPRAQTTMPVLKGSLGDVLSALSSTLHLYPRNVPGAVEVEELTLKYADLHTFFHKAIKLFSEKFYDCELPTETPRILDCGGNIGLTALYFKSKYPQARIQIFEADASVASLCAENLATFGYPDVLVHTRVVSTHAQSSAASAVGGSMIPSVRLKDVLAVEEFDLMKLDIEDAAFEVITDCKDVLHRAKRLIIEVQEFEAQRRTGALLSILEQAGFCYMLAGVDHAPSLKTAEPSPFTACQGNGYRATIFAWRR
jgi:FkbM family methyltransferase